MLVGLRNLKSHRVNRTNELHRPLLGGHLFRHRSNALFRPDRSATSELVSLDRTNCAPIANRFAGVRHLATVAHRCEIGLMAFPGFVRLSFLGDKRLKMFSHTGNGEEDEWPSVTLPFPSIDNNRHSWTGALMRFAIILPMWPHLSSLEYK